MAAAPMTTGMARLRIEGPTSLTRLMESSFGWAAGAEAVLAARLDKTLAPTAVRVPAGHVLTAGLGASFGAITVAKA